MPRRKQQSDLRTERIRTHLGLYLKSERGRQSEIQQALGIPQYTLSRFITGRKRQLTPEILAVCKYAGIDTDNGINEYSGHGRLQSVITQLWDGTPETADIIATFLESLIPCLLKIIAL